MKSISTCGLTLVALLAGSMAARAEIFVSANDGKQLRAGDTLTGPEPDNISVLNLTGGKLKLLGSLAAPATITGPPHAVAIAKSGKFALVTSAQKFSGNELVLDDVVSVVDLSVPTNPHILQTAHAGPGASGVSISPDGKLALVASTGDDSITVFSIAGKSLSQVNKVQMEAKSGPTDVVFTPDGKSVVVVGRSTSKLMVLTVDGTHVANTGRSFAAGRGSYGAVMTHDGKYVITSNLQGALLPPGAPQPQAGRGAAGRGAAGAPAPAAGGAGRSGSIAMTNIATGQVVASFDTGPTPEHIGISADGRYVVVTAQNGSAVMKSDPAFANSFGLVHVLAVGDGTLTLVASAHAGHWGQGAAFSRDNKTLLLQCAVEREIEVFHFDGKTLIQNKAASVRVGGRPSAIATAYSR